MTGINHSVTGTIIANALPLPLALPLAFVSHFVLDMLPHFGEIYEKRKKLSKTVWAIDISLAVAFNLFLLLNHHWVILACSLIAISPDFLWVYRFTVQERFGKLPPKPCGTFNRFHAGIQKLENRMFLPIEIIWLGAAFAYAGKFLW